MINKQSTRIIMFWNFFLKTFLFIVLTWLWFRVVDYQPAKPVSLGLRTVWDPFKWSLFVSLNGILSLVELNIEFWVFLNECSKRHEPTLGTFLMELTTEFVGVYLKKHFDWFLLLKKFSLISLSSSRILASRVNDWRSLLCFVFDPLEVNILNPTFFDLSNSSQYYPKFGRLVLKCDSLFRDFVLSMKPLIEITLEFVLLKIISWGTVKSSKSSWLKGIFLYSF